MLFKDQQTLIIQYTNVMELYLLIIESMNVIIVYYYYSRYNDLKYICSFRVTEDYLVFLDYTGCQHRRLKLNVSCYNIHVSQLAL